MHTPFGDLRQERELARATLCPRVRAEWPLLTSWACPRNSCRFLCVLAWWEILLGRLSCPSERAHVHNVSPQATGRIYGGRTDWQCFYDGRGGGAATRLTPIPYIDFALQRVLAKVPLPQRLGFREVCKTFADAVAVGVNGLQLRLGPGSSRCACADVQRLGTRSSFWGITRFLSRFADAVCCIARTARLALQSIFLQSTA